MKWLSGGVVPKSSIRKLPNTSRRRRTPSSTLSKTMTTGKPCTPSADSQWSSVVNWECLQYHLQRMRRTPPMLAAQRPRPNTRVTNSSGPSWNQKRSTGNTHNRWNRLTWTKTKTHRWLKAAGPKAETEGFIIAAQDQSLPTRWHQHHILKKPDVDLKCRLCGRFDKTIDHLVSGCPELAKTEYIHHHNKAAAHMQWKICKEFGIEVKERWYEHEPKTLTENDSVTILWDMPIHTDRNVAANTPDIVLKNKKDKTCLLIDMTIPLDTNTSVKTMEKLNKYKELEIDVKWMWGLKTTTVPVVMGALGTIKKDMENYSNKIPGNINIHELQKITLFSTAHLLRRVLFIT